MIQITDIPKATGSYNPNNRHVCKHRPRCNWVSRLDVLIIFSSVSCVFFTKLAKINQKCHKWLEFLWNLKIYFNIMEWKRIKEKNLLFALVILSPYLESNYRVFPSTSVWAQTQFVCLILPQLSCFFFLFSAFGTKNFEKADFDKRLEFTATKRWSTFTTHNVSFSRGKKTA